MSKIEIKNGDSLNLLAKLDEDSVDFICSDFPYGYQFMGKKWDIDVPSVAILKECLRVLKPGHWLVTTMSPRQDVSTECLLRLKQAGFEIAYSSLAWCYNSGFTKAQNCYKALDKRAFGQWCKKQGYIKIKDDPLEKEILKYDDHQNNLTTRQNPFMSGKNIVKTEKYTNKIIETNDSGDFYYHKSMKEKRIPEKELKTQWSKSLGETLQVKEYEHPQRQNRSYVTDSNVFSGDRKHDALEEKQLSIQKPVTSEAKRLEGWYSGFQLQPARELILVAKKPNTEKLKIDQALSNWGDCTHIYACRIPYEELQELLDNYGKGECGHSGSGTLGWNTGEPQKIHAKLNAIQKKKLLKKLIGGRLTQEKRWNSEGKKVDGFKTQDLEDIDLPEGRFPANLIISDDFLNDGKITKSSGGLKPRKDGFIANSNYVTAGTEGYGDSGSASRYYSLELWWNKFMTTLPKPVQQTMPMLQVPKPDNFERKAGLPEIKKKDKDKEEQHPTMKPIQLFCYLLTMFSKPGDLIVDPFNGSGTTMISCLITNRDGLGFDIDPEYCKIAGMRLKYWDQMYRRIKGSWADVLAYAKKRAKKQKRPKGFQLISSFLKKTEPKNKV